MAEKLETKEELEKKIAAIESKEKIKAEKKAKADAIKTQVRAAKRRQAGAKAHELVCDADEVVRIVGVLAHRIKHYGHDSCADADSDLFKKILEYSRGCVDDVPKVAVSKK